MRDTIKLTNAALDETTSREIILRGVLDADSLKFLKIGEYQRETLPKSSIKALMDALQSESVPDIDLGMRGGGYIEREGAFYLQDDVYIIDGLQRVSAGLEHLAHTTFVPRLGAVIHFNSSESFERNRFKMLNTSRTPLSPNVLLRNARKDWTVVEMVYNLCFDNTFALYDRVSWQQRMNRHHLTTASTLMRVVGLLHSGFGQTKSASTLERLRGLQKAMNTVGRTNMRGNIASFFELIDESWEVRKLQYKESSTIVKQGFLSQVARILAEHANFWAGTKLTIARDLRKKIAMFPVDDREVKNLASATGKAGEILYRLLVDHINSGRRTGHLAPFKRLIASTKQPEVFAASSAIQ